MEGMGRVHQNRRPTFPYQIRSSHAAEFLVCVPCVRPSVPIHPSRRHDTTRQSDGRAGTVCLPGGVPVPRFCCLCVHSEWMRQFRRVPSWASGRSSVGRLLAHSYGCIPAVQQCSIGSSGGTENRRVVRFGINLGSHPPCLLAAAATVAIQNNALSATPSPPPFLVFTIPLPSSVSVIDG